MTCRSTVHILHRNEAAPLCEPTRTGERDESVYHFGSGKAFLCNEQACSDAWKWHFESQWAKLGTPEEASCS